jgi:2-hydroxy-6-oxonona-2,4-dienedioate hydrolase
MTNPEPRPAAPVPDENYRSFWTDLFGYAYTIGFLDAGGVRTRYLEAGDPAKPTVVMMHGISGSLEMFTANIGPLSEHFHVLALDLVGFGLSGKSEHDLEIHHYVEHLEAFLDAKGVGEFSFFSVSMGTWTSVAFAARHPERVRRLVLTAPAGLLNPPEKAARRSQEQAAARADNPSWENASRSLDHLFYDPASKIPDTIATRYAIARQPEMAASTRHIMSVLSPNAIERNRIPESTYAALTAPVLLVECPDSVDLSFHMIQKIRTLIPNCEVLSVPRAAHWPHFEQPATVNPVAIRFLGAADPDRS